MSHKGVIALDADGVLIDYHQGYKVAWERAFDERLTEVNPTARHPGDRWGVRFLRHTSSEYKHFRACLDAMWSCMPAMPDAGLACRNLTEAGYVLICVTALSPRFQADRLQNLRELNLPISFVHATGSADDSSVSPKAKILSDIAPCAFVDDFAPYLRGVPRSIHLGLIDPFMSQAQEMSADDQLAHSKHVNLLEFSKFWLLHSDSST